MMKEGTCRIIMYVTAFCVYPAVVSVLLCGAIWIAGYYFRIPFPEVSASEKDVILQSGITVGSIFVGFSTVLKSTYLTLSSRGMVKLRKSDLNKSILQYIWLSLISALAFVGCCFVNLFWDHHSYIGWRCLSWCYCAIWMVTSFLYAHWFIDGHIDK